MDESLIEGLRNEMTGEVVTPADPGYDDARKVWNARFDRRPGAIARCSEDGDVVAACRLARDNDLDLSVRSGGHDYAGKSVCDGGVAIDLSAINQIRIDEDAKRATVGPGVRWGDFDREAQKAGLATTGGTVSTVGVAGYTLGGGSGWLSRRHGLALDNLRSARVVLASGEVVEASDEENEDLFWALRGGSGNFGVVTAFEYELHEMGPEVLTGQVFFPLEDAGEVLRFFRSFIAAAPDEIQCYPFFLRVPPLEMFPKDQHGKLAIDLVVAYVGDPSAGEAALEPVRSFGEPFLSAIARQPYTELQQSFDAGMPAGNRWYSKAHYLRELSDEAIDLLLRHVETMPGAFSVTYLEPMGGAIARVDPGATAFPHRDAPYSLHIFAGWQSASEDDEAIGWGRGFHEAMSKFATGGIYVNLLDGDEEDVRRAAWGSNYERLARIKRKYDPTNLFRHNQNIDPSG